MVAATRRVFTPAALLATFALVFATSIAIAQPTGPPDHYKVYRAAPIPSPYTPPVGLTDQFGRSDHQVLELDRFANPVEKEHLGEIFPIFNPELHYAWWRISEVPFSAIVAIDNQFGDQSLVLGPARYLLNPALKNHGGSPGTSASGVPTEPPLANHYKCYECQGSDVDEPITMTDQFHTYPARAVAPRFFCTPTEKQLADGTLYPPVEPDVHYTCYVFDPPDFTTWTALFTDQFVFEGQLVLSPGEMICLPTLKIDPTPTEQGTWGRLKTMYR